LRVERSPPRDGALSLSSFRSSMIAAPVWSPLRCSITPASTLRPVSGVRYRRIGHSRRRGVRSIVPEGVRNPNAVRRGGWRHAKGGTVDRPRRRAQRGGVPGSQPGGLHRVEGFETGRPPPARDRGSREAPTRHRRRRTSFHGMAAGAFEARAGVPRAPGGNLFAASFSIAGSQSAPTHCKAGNALLIWPTSRPGPAPKSRALAPDLRSARGGSRVERKSRYHQVS
jgi:hypothetical protein